MARKEIRVPIIAEGRDKGKIFVIKEMSATQAEKWAARALIALAKSGMDVPEDVANAGFAAVAVMGLRALGGMNFAEAEPLMDEMFSCVSIQPGPDVNIVRPLLEQDIEEVATRVALRIEVFNLHAGFSIAGSPSPQAETGTPAQSSTRNHLTSPAPLPRVSRQARQR